MRKISWNELAKRDYLDNIDFLLNKWNEKIAQEFINDVYEIEFMLKNGNVDFQETDRPGIKRCVIREQITLFYKIIDNSNIEFLRFWNNHKDPKNLKYKN